MSKFIVTYAHQADVEAYNQMTRGERIAKGKPTLHHLQLESIGVAGAIAQAIRRVRRRIAIVCVEPIEEGRIVAGHDGEVPCTTPVKESIRNGRPA